MGIGAVLKVCDTGHITRAQECAASVVADPSVVRYAVQIVAATRESRAVALGAGTRGAIGLVKAGKALALLRGRDFVTPDDIKSATLPVLRHRLQLTPEMAIGGQGVDAVLASIVEGVAAPRS